MRKPLFIIILFLTGYFGYTSRIQKAEGRLIKERYNVNNDHTDAVNPDSSVLHTGWYYILDSPNNYKRQLAKSNQTFFIDPKPIVTAKNITTLEIETNTYNGKHYFMLTMRLDQKGKENWSVATEKAYLQQSMLAFIINNQLLQVARINSQITSGVTALNRSDFEKQELEAFKTLIEKDR